MFRAVNNIGRMLKIARILARNDALFALEYQCGYVLSLPPSKQVVEVNPGLTASLMTATAAC